MLSKCEKGAEYSKLSFANSNLLIEKEQAKRMRWREIRKDNLFMNNHKQCFLLFVIKKRKLTI